MPTVFWNKFCSIGMLKGTMYNFWAITMNCTSSVLYYRMPIKDRYIQPCEIKRLHKQHFQSPTSLTVHEYCAKNISVHSGRSDGHTFWQSLRTFFVPRVVFLQTKMLTTFEKRSDGYLRMEHCVVQGLDGLSVRFFVLVEENSLLLDQKRLRADIIYRWRNKIALSPELTKSLATLVRIGWFSSFAVCKQTSTKEKRPIRFEPALYPYRVTLSASVSL